MFIRAVEIRINSGNERFGFRCKFDSGLNIIKGRNSSGKSTLVNTLMYALGLEELIGVKGERALTSAVQDRFQYDGRPHEIKSLPFSSNYKTLPEMSLLFDGQSGMTISQRSLSRLLMGQY